MTVWHDEQAEHDLAGAALVSARGSRLVGATLNLEAIYDRLTYLVINTAISLPADVELDTQHRWDPVLGLHYEAMGRVLLGSEVRRLIAVSERVNADMFTLATWVVMLPCSPCSSCVRVAAEHVHMKAVQRHKVAALREAERFVLTHPQLADLVEVAVRAA